MENEKTITKGNQEENIPVKSQDKNPKDIFNKIFEEDFWLEPFSIFRTPSLSSLFNRQFFPRVDVSETNKEVRVVADVPGVNPDNINIEIRDRNLILSGKSEKINESDEKPYRYERSYGEFYREFLLPTNVKEEEVKASFKDGVLKIFLPKTEEDKPKKKIAIERV